MNSRIKIIVLKLKELIQLGIFVALCLILILLLWVAFRPKQNSPASNENTPVRDTSQELSNAPDADSTLDISSIAPSSSESLYIPGIYTTALVLGNQTVDLEVVVDRNLITSVRLVNLDEAVATMYPLLEPALESISTQLYEGVPLDAVTYGEENKYTSLILLNAVEQTLSKAIPVN